MGSGDQAVQRHTGGYGVADHQGSRTSQVKLGLGAARMLEHDVPQDHALARGKRHLPRPLTVLHVRHPEPGADAERPDDPPGQPGMQPLPVGLDAVHLRGPGHPAVELDVPLGRTVRGRRYRWRAR